MEVIAFLTLAVAGFVINKRQSTHASTRPGRDMQDGDMMEDADDLYESRQYERAHRVEEAAAHRSFQKSKYPEETGVISRNFTDDVDQVAMTNRRRGGDDGVSGLSGVPTDFSHTNMKPFFGGHVRQSLNPAANNDILEAFTGVTPQGGVPPPSKIEKAPMFAPVPVGNVFGTPSIDLEAAIDRLPVQRFKDNDIPFQQVMVGPAIGGGFTPDPSDGYLSGRQYQLPKNTDQLRTSDDPKLSYPGRTVAGAQSIQARGELGVVDSPRYPQRYRETFGADDWMKTTGQNLGEASRPEQLLKDVQRPDMHIPYKGSAAPTSLSTSSYTGVGEASASHKSESQRLQLGPAAACAVASTKGDYGRANILVYANERDTTNVPVFSGSSTTVVKSVIAPLLDMIRPARRQVLGTTAARSFGNISMMIPDKQTVRDLDGSLRTTIRETTQQVTSNPGALGSMRGPTLLTVYDPSDVAKTTLKEQIIHDTSGALAPAPNDRRTGARNDDTTRTTTRQTLDCTNTSINPSVPSRGQLLRDPDLDMKNTVKQTTVSAVRAETDGASVGSLQGARGGYTTSDVTTPPTTTRQFLSMQEDDHVGGAGTSVMSTSDGYRVANATPRDTQREDTSDNSYYGTAKQGDAQMSHEEYQSATVRPDKEILAVNSARDFVASGLKETLGKDAVDPGDLRKVSLSTGFDSRPPGVGRIMQQTADMKAQGFPEVGRENTSGLTSHRDEGTRGHRGTYAKEMAQPRNRFDEDVKALTEARAMNPTANLSFYGR